MGIFSAGLRPTGNKDPFALRRAALGLDRPANVTVSTTALHWLGPAELARAVLG